MVSVNAGIYMVVPLMSVAHHMTFPLLNGVPDLTYRPLDPLLEPQSSPSFPSNILFGQVRSSVAVLSRIV